MEKLVAEFQVKHRAILDKDGNCLADLPEFCNRDSAVEMYRMMVLSRLFDSKAIALQRTGKLGTYPSVLGQEAISVGVGAAMQKDDVFCPYYRDIGAQFWRGVKMEEILDYWGGNEEGSNFSDSNVAKDFPCCVPIASQTLHAVGVATALKYKGKNNAAVTTIGDGGTSRGDFYEALNVAGVWKLPVVFIVNNNQWAISVSSDNQTAAQTFAQKAFAAGLSCEQIDGNDILMVRKSVEDALARAYSGEGAHVIEMITYRMCDHTTADDASRYRDTKELEENKNICPIKRTKLFLEKNYEWTKEEEDNLYEKCHADVSKSVDVYLNREKRSAVEMFEYIYEKLPIIYEEQRQEVAYYESANNSN